jgi:hypothetical protein
MADAKALLHRTIRLFQSQAQVTGKQSARNRIINETAWVEEARKKENSASLAFL